MQQVDRCDTDIGQSDDQGTVHRPIKVIKPVMELWMEQSRFGSLIREPNDSIGLVSIARSTRETEVFEVSLAAKRQRLDVFDFKGDNRKRFT